MPFDWSWLMETKPTPGPWYIKTRQARFDPTVVIEDGVCGPDGEQIKVCGMTLTSSAEAKANARLIAAAPEMLEALREIIAVAEGKHLRPIMGIDAVRRAIAKATGE
jgi:hypothetical protein